MGRDIRAIWKLSGGDAPENWSFATFEDLLEDSKNALAVGVMYPGKHTTDGVPLIKVSDVKDGRVIGKPDFLISPEKDEEYKRTRLIGNELLITLVGNPGDCALVTDDMADWNVARAIAVVRLEDQELRNWVRLALLSRPAQHFMSSRFNTTVQRTLNLKDIREIALPIPPPSVREQITELASTLDDKIEMNRRMNSTLESMARALFKSWFVDFDPVIDKALAAGNPIPEPLSARAETRRATATKGTTGTPTLPAHIQKLFPDAFHFDHNVGWLPETWAPGTLEDMVVLQRGFDLPKRLRTDGVVPLMVASGQDGTHNESKVSAPGITTGRSGKLGVVNFVHRDFWPLNTTLWVKEYKSSSPYHALYLLRSLDLEKYNSGSAVPTLNRNHVHNIKLAVPPVKVVDEHASMVAGLYERIDFGVQQVAQLTKLRDTLLPQLLSGELRIPDAEQLVADSL